jgi:acyl carrier protein
MTTLRERLEPRPPRAEIVSGVRRIWCRVLERASVDDAQDFFALGGDSLRAMRMLAAVQGELGVEVPLEIFAAPVTVGIVAERVETLLNEAAPSATDAREFGEL